MVALHEQLTACMSSCGFREAHLETGSGAGAWCLLGTRCAPKVLLTSCKGGEWIDRQWFVIVHDGLLKSMGFMLQRSNEGVPCQTRRGWVTPRSTPDPLDVGLRSTA